jgi:hypothetical protein
VTIEAGGQQVRVPSISAINVCTEPAGLPGIPWVSTSGCGSPCASVIITSGSGSSGYVVVRYTSDGAPQEVKVPIPGTGGGSEVCLAGVGAPARADCLVKISVDNLPTPPPTPTVPPVSPEPLPTLPPTPDPDPFCVGRVCVPYGGSILQEPYDTVQRLVSDLIVFIRDEVDRFLSDPCSYVFGNPCL